MAIVLFDCRRTVLILILSEDKQVSSGHLPEVQDGKLCLSIKEMGTSKVSTPRVDGE